MAKARKKLPRRAPDARLVALGNALHAADRAEQRTWGELDAAEDKVKRKGKFVHE